MPHNDDSALRIVQVDRALDCWGYWRSRKPGVALQAWVNLRDVEPGLDRTQEGDETFGIIARILHLAGMNLSGKAAKISQLTWRTVMIIASTTRPRRPFILRNKNVTKSPMSSSSLPYVGTWQSQDRRKSFGARAI